MKSEGAPPDPQSRALDGMFCGGGRHPSTNGVPRRRTTSNIGGDTFLSTQGLQFGNRRCRLSACRGDSHVERQEEHIGNNINLFPRPLVPLGSWTGDDRSAVDWCVRESASHTGGSSGRRTKEDEAAEAELVGENKWKGKGNRSRRWWVESTVKGCGGTWSQHRDVQR